jgi:membrane protease YdiL (CAAX protease family)
MNNHQIRGIMATKSGSRFNTLSTTTQARRSARGLLVFFSVLVPLSVAFESMLIITNDDLFVIGLMMTPMLASLAARVALKEGIRDVSFRLGGRRTVAAILFALLFPFVVGAVSYLPAWASGLEKFVAPDPANLLKSLILGATLGFILAAGEEIGWRGYMLTRLVHVGAPAPLLVSGLIWGAWHAPIVFTGAMMTGRPAVLTTGIFLVTITSFAYLVGRLRLESGSVWPAVVMHAAWNSVIQDLFDRSTEAAGWSMWTGESGVLVAVTVLVVAIVFSLVVRPPHNLDFPQADLRSRRN